MPSKRKENGDIELTPVCFNSTTKAMINSDKYMLDKSFQEILYRIDYWINEVSGWVIESMNKEYVNICIFSPLSWSACIELPRPRRLRNSMKGPINIKNRE